jgi:hypothetical protein
VALLPVDIPQPNRKQALPRSPLGTSSFLGQMAWDDNQTYLLAAVYRAMCKPVPGDLANVAARGRSALCCLLSDDTRLLLSAKD